VILMALKRFVVELGMGIDQHGQEARMQLLKQLKMQ
jgi:hypothetical protein